MIDIEKTAETCRFVYRTGGLRQALLYLMQLLGAEMAVERINAIVCHDDLTSLVNIADTDAAGVANKYYQPGKRHPVPAPERMFEPVVIDELETFRSDPGIRSCLGDRSIPSLRYMSLLRIPLFSNGRSVFLVNFWSMRRAAFNAGHLEMLEGLLSLLAAELKDNMVEDRPAVRKQGAPGELLTGMEKLELCPGLVSIREVVEGLASCMSTVLILGETGVGKEAVASAIHATSDRKDGPFIRVNCGAIPENLIDSELFGYEKGAFTGATATKPGFFELADGGTLFLDEIGEMSLATQVRFLRVLEDGMVRHIGGAKEIAVDVRIVAATHNNLSDRVLSGSFRKDLWYRLSVLVLEVPPLRRRLDDLPYLVRHFVERKAALMGLKRIPAVPAEEMMKLLHYPWPGNVRELEHVVERALIKELLTNRGKLVFEYIPLKESGEHAESAAVPPDGSDAEEAGRDWPTLREFENRYIRDVMRHCGGKLTGSGSATSILDIHYTTLRARLREMGLEGAS